MIRSMTGYGRCEKELHGRRLSVEIKSVNHRYLDVSIKLPRRFNAFDGMLRSLLKEYTERGKADIYVSCEELSGGAGSLKYDSALAGEYMKYLKQMAGDFGIEGEVSLGLLARFPDVFTTGDEEADEEELKADLEEVFREAASAFSECRRAEGENLAKDMLDKLDYMEETVAQIVERSPQLVGEYRKKLEDKIREVIGDASIDEARLMTELTIYADRVCVDEEMVRLKSHITAMRSELKSGGAVGRKLDFIAQEMNREANTTLSKMNDPSITDAAIGLKTCIEKIREQVQNLE
ncbi:MAG: YicC family protein [Lachnospiraceae bacterium]|nr:YicC family protein [Lachnospiraceae bacterium]